MGHSGNKREIKILFNCFSLVLRNMEAICRMCREKGSTIQKALHAACTEGHEHCAVPLIEAGADVNAPIGREKITPLELAVFSRSPDLVDALINAGADVNADIGHFISNLHIAADKVHNAEKFVNLLIEAGADVNKTRYGRRTALMTAALRGTSPNVITALINAGADVNAHDSYGRCAISCAAERNFIKGLELLIEAADKTDPTRSYLPPLSVIKFELRRLTISTLKLLLRIGLKINMPNRHNNNTLTYYIVQCKRESDRVSKYICMFLFAAGEIFTGPIVEETAYYNNITVRAEVPEYLFHKELQMCMKHLCREAIRKHLLAVDPHEHLFGRVPKLGLPKSLTNYLVYEMTLDDLTTPTDWCECSRSHEAAHWCRLCRKS